MIRYFDASALVKRYVKEEHTNRVARLFESSERHATTRYSAVEVGSALNRREREGDLPEPELERLVAQLNQDLARMLVVELTPVVVRRALAMLKQHALRAGDAVQLASACHLRERTGTVEQFVCYDERLSKAALSEGFSVET